VQLTIPFSMNFGSVKVGKSKMGQLTVSNPKGKTKRGLPVLIEGVSGGPGFSATTGSCPAMLASGAKCKLDVTFTAMSKGKQRGTLTIKDNAIGAPQNVQLNGTGK
jgi:hypothetical protein